MLHRRTPAILAAMVFVFVEVAAVVSAAISDTAALTGVVSSCLPEVRIRTSPSPYTICLNTMNPGKDSCVAVTIDCSRLFGAFFRFTCSDTGTWRYSGMEGTDTAGRFPELRIELTNGPDGNLVFVDIYPYSSSDSLPLPPNLRIDNDRPAAPDTLSRADIGIRRTVYDCHLEIPKIVFVERTYTYPPGFRRDPVINQAERSMFHSGMSVRMPTAQSLENRAQLFIYWHCQALADLEFENPAEIVRSEAAVNRLRKKRAPAPVKKKSKILLRPLR